MTNHVLVITRWRVDPEDCAVLNSFSNIRLTVLVTHSGIDDDRIEPVDSHIAATGLRTLHTHAERYRTILYWRPIVLGLNDTDAHLQRARELSEHAHATVFTGLFFSTEIAAYYQAHGLPLPYQDSARRKILPEQAEKRILDFFHNPATSAPRHNSTSAPQHGRPPTRPWSPKQPARSALSGRRVSAGRRRRTSSSEL
ncbi:MAG: hypothetical protein ACRDTF_03805 [Pseudonocardiaceae bacterium]